MPDSKTQKQPLLQRWKAGAKKLKSEVYALYFAVRDPRVPWYAKLLLLFILGYAFSPIDLIPDFIPILGYLDDLILIPFLVSLALRMMPREVMEEAREKSHSLSQKPKNWIGAAVIILIWAAVIFMVIRKIM